MVKLDSKRISYKRAPGNRLHKARRSTLSLHQQPEYQTLLAEIKHKLKASQLRAASGKSAVIAILLGSRHACSGEATVSKKNQ